MLLGDRFRIYYDAEFTGLHRNTTLVSIGLVTQEGTMFYAEFTDYDQSQVDDWLKEHVISNLPYAGVDSCMYKTPATGSTHPKLAHYNIFIKHNKEMIGKVLNEWLLNEHSIAGHKIQFFTDCYAYDWVLLNDLICPNGKALNLPSYIDYIPIDLSTLMAILDIDPDITREDFIGPEWINEIQNIAPFKNWGDSIKHNSLWDAQVASICFDKCLALTQ